MTTVLSKFTLHNFDEKKTDLMIMRSGFHSHHHETWVLKKNRSHTNTLLIKYREVFLKNNLIGISFIELLILSSNTQMEWKRYLFKNYN